MQTNAVKMARILRDVRPINVFELSIPKLELQFSYATR